MSRSPWREALDGQVKVVRELRRLSTRMHLGQQANVRAIREELTDPVEYAQFAMQFGQTLSKGIEMLVREAEPIYLSPDIHLEVMRYLDVISKQRAVGRRQDLEIERQPLTEAMLPISRGFLYLPGEGLTLREVPSDSDIPPGQVVIRAIYFGDSPVMETYKKPGSRTYTIDCRSSGAEERTGMGGVIFVESRASGYVRMTEEFGDHLVPVPLDNWRYGLTLHEWMSNHETGERAEGLNLEGTRILMQATGTYLYVLFRMMLQRITRWGGVGLNREERKEAEREQVGTRVQLVTWRKAEYRYPEGYLSVPKNWSCRWPVTEHIRRYKDGRTTKVRSYIKGPDSLPLKEANARVHQVSR